MGSVCLITVERGTYALSMLTLTSLWNDASKSPNFPFGDADGYAKEVPG